MAVVRGEVGAAVGLVVLDEGVCEGGAVCCACVLQPAATTNAPSTDTTNLATLTAANYLLCGGHGSHSINWAATVAPSSQHDSRSALLGLPETNTYSAAFTHPKPVVMAETPFSAPSVPSLPWR
jgi:hypothetical protein